MLETYLKPIFAFALNRTDSSAEAEELAQEIMYQAVYALSKPRAVKNYDSFLWSIAHNTYKRWLQKRRVERGYTQFEDNFGNIMKPVESIETVAIEMETMNLLRRELSLLTGNYRRAIVLHYYNEMTCEQIAKKLGISTEMCKYYLAAGKRKLREGIEMVREFGEKSFNPSIFHIYKSGWSTIDIWSLFNRKLPCNIVLASYDSPIDIPSLSIEMGVPSVYLEDEVKTLTDVGLIKQVSKGKLQTAFFIADAKLIEHIEDYARNTISQHIDALEEAFKEVLPVMQTAGLFKQDVSEVRYKWLFMQLQNILDIPFSTDYPKILSDGSENFIWGEEAERSAWSGGRTPREGTDHVLHTVDILRLGVKHQDYLRNKGPALLDLAQGRFDNDKAEVYASLVRDGYAVKVGNTIHPNIPVFTSETGRIVQTAIDEATQRIHDEINVQGLLDGLTRLIAPRMTQIVQGKPEEYASLILSVHVEGYIYEGMHSKGYLPIPESGENDPMTSFIVVK